jgi:O-antigen/teichoic acid export membrane protein
MALVRRILGFALLPVASAFAPLVVLPLVSRVGGTETWAAVGIGTAIGGLVSSFSFAGYSVSGTAAVAVEQDKLARLALYARGFWVRLAVLLLTFPVGVLVAGVISPSGARVEGLLFAAAFAVGGLSMSWYATGIGRPRDILMFEAGPRVLASLIAAVLIGATGLIWVYPVLLGIVTLGGVAAYNWALCRRPLPPRDLPSGLMASVKHYAAGWGVEIVGSGYSSIPVPLAGGLAGSAATAPYVSADRVYRYGFVVVNALGSALQSWVLERDSRRRQATALGLHILVGVCGAVFLIVAGRWLAILLFGSAVAPPEALFLPLALAFLATCTATPLMRNILIPRGFQRQLLQALALTGVCGVLAMVVIGITTKSVLGIASGLAFSEVAMLTWVTVLVVKQSRLRLEGR